MIYAIWLAPQVWLLTAILRKKYYDLVMFKKLLLMALIAFVPVQSWAITSMGIQLDQAAMQYSHSIVSVPVHACHQNAAPQAEYGQDHHSKDDSGCSSCTLCMAIGLVQISTKLDLSDYLHQAPSSADRTWISANFSSLIKPPIF